MSMKYFKDQSNQVFAYNADGSQDVFILQGLEPISEAEADLLRAAIGQPSVEAWRETARLEKGAFVTALLDANILTGSEAIQASKGDWPQTFASALASLPVDPIKAQVQWGAAAHIARNNPLFIAVLGYYAATHDLTPEAAEALGDSIFGWGAEPSDA